MSDARGSRRLVTGALRGRRAQSLSDRLRRLDRDLHGGARHDHRQCRAAPHRRRPGGRHRRKHLHHHQLSRRQRDRAVDLGLALDRDRPQALLHDLRRDLHVRLAVVRLCLESGGAGAVSHPAGARRRRHGDQRAGDPRRLLSAAKNAARPLRSTASRSWSRR